MSTRHAALIGASSAAAISVAISAAVVGQPANERTAQAEEAPTIAYGAGRRPDAPIPRPGMDLKKDHVAIVITDPQNDFLSPEGVTWGVVGTSVTANNTVANIETLFRTARRTGTPVFVSPHYYYPHDHRWQYGGAVETMMHGIKMFDRTASTSAEGLSGSGADWLERYKPYIETDETVVCSPHKVYGPESNDLALQLRKAGIEQVILAGMSANLCVESHMRELIEQGFQVVVVADATAAAQLPGYDGYEAAFVNFRLIASDIWSTREATARLNDLR